MFTGITQDAMWLLAQNRFENSKAFYEEHKPRIQQEVVQPLRELLAELGDTAQEIDPKILIDPNRNGAVSRVRRDNRYTHDKSLYRENMWIALMRDKKAYECAPGFFMDFSLNDSTYGLGFRWCPPGLMQALRAEIDDKPQAFLKAVKAAADAGFAVEGNRYARPKKQGLPPLLDGLANRKTVSVVKFEPDPAFFGSASLTDTLKKAFRTLAPLYRLLMGAAERELLSREI